MVSFQCLACHDVVTKPKLDQHRSRCHDGFDCIDCGKTYKTPAEYKGHTSCISEAQKYQKSLYKGPKTKGVNSTHQPNSLLDKTLDATNTSVPRQSNAQWNRNSQATSFDNVNGYPGTQYQHQQNGWRNDRDNHRHGDRGRRSSGWQQNRSSASGANDTPLGTSRRPSVDDQTDVLASEPGNGDGVSQKKCRAEETEAKAKATKEKRIRNTDNYPQTGKERPNKPNTPKKAEEHSAVVNNDVKEDEEKKVKKRKKKGAGPETGIAEADTAGSDIKEKVKKEKRRREKEADDAAGSENKKKTKKKKREANGEPDSVGVGDAGSENKKKAKKNADSDEIPAAVDSQTTKMPVVPKKKKKRDTIAETATDVHKREGDVELKKKRKRHEEHNDDTKKRRKHMN